MRKLKHKGTYKDGGSKSYMDELSGEMYWLSNKFGKKYKDIKGVLFKGSINDKKNWKRAKGSFILVSLSHSPKEITQ